MVRHTHPKCMHSYLCLATRDITEIFRTLAFQLSIFGGVWWVNGRALHLSVVELSRRVCLFLSLAPQMQTISESITEEINTWFWVKDEPSNCLQYIDIKSISLPSSKMHLQKLLKISKNFSDELQMDFGIDKQKSICIVKGQLTVINGPTISKDQIIYYLGLGKTCL